MDPSDHLRKLISGLPALKSKILDVIEVEAEKHFSENFDKEGFQGDSFQPWKDRKKEDSSRRLLISSGDLRRSATTAERRAGGLAFVMNQPYARVHNEGLQSGRGAGFTMPKRQFIGPSKLLDEKIRKKIETVITQHLNSL